MTTPRRTVRLDDTLWERFQAAARAQGGKPSVVLRGLVEDFVAAAGVEAPQPMDGQTEIEVPLGTGCPEYVEDLMRPGRCRRCGARKAAHGSTVS